MKFNYDAEIVERLKRKKTLITIITVIIFGIGAILIYDWSSNLSYLERKQLNSNPNTLILFIAIIAFGVISLYPIIQIMKTSQCLQTNYINITPNEISGIVCNDFKSSDNIRHFLLSPSEIINIEKAPIDSLYTVYIHTKTDTYKLCVENADIVISQINSYIYNKSNNQIWQCPKCKKEVFYGQLTCVCGQNFDWTKL